MLALYFTLLTTLATGSLAVLNSEPAIPHQFPYHVGIFWQTKLSIPVSLSQYYCGGAIVTDKWVLTAAHCVRRFGEMVVKAGKHVLNQPETYEQVRFVEGYVIHPDYQPPVISGTSIAMNDLAFLKVASPFILNEYINVAKIPSTSAYFEYGSLAGWGSKGKNYFPSFPKELHYNKYLPVVDVQTCAHVISNISFVSVNINCNQICSGPVGEHFGACLLDDGSAFVSRENHEYVIIGVVSWNHLLCGTFGAPTVYTRVSAYSEWIQGFIGSS